MQGAATPQPSSGGEPGTGRTPAVALPLALRSRVHPNNTALLSTAENAKLAPRPLVLLAPKVSTGAVASTAKSCPLDSAYPANVETKLQLV